MSAAEPSRENALPAAPAEPKRKGVFRRFLRHRLAVLGLIFIVTISLGAILAPWISPYDPYKMDLGQTGKGPSLSHPLGTDRLGRDTLTRILYGGRVSLAVGLTAVTISTAIGTILGFVAGYTGRWVDALIMRVTDVFMSFPLILLLIVSIPILGPKPINIVLILGLFTWMGVARLVRGQTIAVMNEPYVEAAVAGGSTGLRIVTKHVLPNSAAPIVVASTLGIANAMLSEAALSFLGLGIQPPIPSWGNMLHSAQQLQVLVNEPWVWMGPGTAIALTVLSINFAGDGIRDALDPRHRSRSTESS